MNSTTPQMEASQKKTPKTSFQICVKLAEMGFDTSLDPSMEQMSTRIDRIITASYLMPRTLSGLRLVQVLIESKREEGRTTLSLMSTPLTTIYGDADLSRLDFSTLNEQVISRITTLIKSMLQQAGCRISASCLKSLESELRIRMQYQISLLGDALYSHALELRYRSLDTTGLDVNA